MPVLTLVAAIALLGTTYYSTSLWVDLSLALAAAGCLGVSVLTGRRTYFLQLAVLAMVPVLPSLQWIENDIVHQNRHFQKMAVEGDLRKLAGELQQQLTSNTQHLSALSLLLGHVEDFDQAEYSEWMEELVTHGANDFLNIAVTDDYIITHAYPPVDANTSLVGIDMREIKSQIEDIRWVMEHRKLRVVGPITVMQGDNALVYRMPITHRPNMIVSGVLSLEKLLASASMDGTRAYRMQLSLKHQDRQIELVTAVGVLSHHAVRTSFTQDGVVWEFTAEPASGYAIPQSSLWMARAGGFAAWLFLIAILGHQYRQMQQRERERQHLIRQEKELLEAQRLGGLRSWHAMGNNRYAISAPLAELVGTDKNELHFDEVMELIYEPDRSYFLAQTQQVIDQQLPFIKFEHRLMTRDSLLWVEHSVTLNRDQTLTGMLRDITEIKNSEAELQKLSYYDSLTGASNRNFFSKQVQQGIALSRRNGNHLALVIFDLDDFKTVNDNYGHTLGDEVLKLLTERLKRCIRRSDTVARLAGDTFAVCLQNLKDPGHSIFVADTILKTISELIEVDNVRISVTGTLGIATCPEDDIHYEGLVKKAEMALQRAKEVERGYYHFYSDQLNRENDRRQEILRLLPSALNNDEFYLVLQPRVKGPDQRWSSIEVLIRWESDTLGFVSPGEFIPIAEGSHLIVDIGNWVIRKAIAEFARHLDGLPPDVTLSINLSPKQLEQKDLAHRVSGELLLSGIPADRIEFEITEHSLTVESDTTLTALAELSAMGIRFAMDDFGTGYSNLGMLQGLPLNVLKIDQRFVQQLEAGGKNHELVRAIINMGHTLGLVVVAEGVETAAQVAKLNELGCDELQGFYYYRPQRIESLIEGLAKTQA